MKIVVNGDTKEVKDNLTLLQLIEELGILSKVMASAVNMEIVKKDDWHIHTLKEGDHIELLHFVGGG